MRFQRECMCRRDFRAKQPCHEIDHPLATTGMCGDGETTETSEVGRFVKSYSQRMQCLERPCDTTGLARGNGIGLGCKSDTKFMNPEWWPGNESGNHFICYNTAAEYRELVWTEYENEYGFVPHNYACWSETTTCAERFRLEEQIITRSNPTVCECNDGVCNWTLERQDCSRGYEWIRMPINDLSSHPLADRIVDFNDPRSTSVQSAFIAVDYRPGVRTPALQASVVENQLVVSDEVLNGDSLAYVLTHECSSGSLEWIEGPFDCSPYYDEQGRDRSEVHCYGDPRLHVMLGYYDIIYDGYYKSHKGRILGICRVKVDDVWIPGRLLQFEQSNSHLIPEPQCCPYTYVSTGSGPTQGCNWNGYPTRGGPHGHYSEHRPYQFLYSGNCVTESQARWSDWSEWGECSKTCENGAVTGTRSKTRSCVNGEIGDFGCSENQPTEISEPCGMNLQCQSKGCFLDMNFVDFYRFRLSHVDGMKTSDYWQLNNVYTNRRFDLFAEPRDWSGFFPEGSMVASYRCFDPNTNILDGQEHDATCVCNGDDCDWDREMPVCTQHSTNHAGYSWFMPAIPKEGSYCVAANYGGVGFVENGKCKILMASDLSTAQARDYYKSTLAFSEIDILPFIADDLLENVYPAFNIYNGDQSKSEPDFYELSSICGEAAFKWVSSEEFSELESVHLPTTSAFLRIESIQIEHETAHLCKIDYSNGETCYGRFVAGKCGDQEADGNSVVSILQIDQENCSTDKGAWSDCVGSSGTNCGPGTQSRDGVERSCRGTCTAAHLSQYSFTYQKDRTATACNKPSYPYCLTCGHQNGENQKSYHVRVNGSPVFARYPLTTSRYDQSIFEMACSGGGYWATDYLTGETYYAPGPGETCNFGCAQPMYKLDIDWRVTRQVATCKREGYLENGFQFLNEDSSDLSCHPYSCAIPSFGLWPIADNQQQGTRVSMGVECDGHETEIHHGTWLQVRHGAKCKLVCQAENGAAYRVDTSMPDFAYVLLNVSFFHSSIQV